MKYRFLAVALVFSSGIGSLAQQTQVKTGNYTVVAGDAGNILAFNCSSACTATLTAASTLGATFTVRIFSFGSGTVTISSSSTINGGKTLLKGGVALISSDGSAFYSATTKTYSDAVLTPGDAGNTLTAPSTRTDSSGTVALPANLPAGTQVHITFLLFYDMSAATAGSTRQFALQVATGTNGSGTILCAGEQLELYRSNGNNGVGPAAFDCQFTVLTTGVSGTIHGPTTSNVWVADRSGSGYSDPGDTGTTLHVGVNFPGYNSVGTQTTGYAAASATTFDTTQAYTLRASIGVSGTTTNITYKLREFSMIVTLP